MRHAHAMPFGAAVRDGSVRFRLWAPAARDVAVTLGVGANEVRDMAPLGAGWFEAEVADLRAGERYSFRIDGRRKVPDPASRSNPDGVHGASAVVDPSAYAWRVSHWRGRPWHEAVLYELHVGTFTPEGTFAAAADRFGALADLGITAVELMPVAAFPGSRNWGYDGVLPFAPAASYGTPDDLKRLVDAAHGCGLMVLLDVVYNHFGPEGNYVGVYAPQFFNPRRQTPWGAAINFDGDQCGPVRAFFVHNALYWIDEFRFDGLRLDAVHAIADDSRPDVVTELVDAVREHAGADRHVHIVLENDRNEAHRLVRDAAGRPRHATAQWNDDVHHALHVLATGEHDGYYAEYAERPLWHLGRCLTEGFAFQGEPSPFRGGAPRGEPSADLPAAAFVTFTQTHDQVGNRAFGERLVALADPGALRAAIACVLLAPSPPMLFMGEEFGATTPFLFFCDFGAELAAAVTRGRRAEFSRFARFRDAVAQAAIPDPNDPATQAASCLDRREATSPAGLAWLAFYRRCLDVRRTYVVPRLESGRPEGSFTIERDCLLRARWRLGGGMAIHLAANFSPSALADVAALPGDSIFESDDGIATGRTWPAWGTALTVEAEA
ncbi:MAG: malto-oligosyltrehalose trehalohydrolase [Burkholderiales bacterium]